jgi:hypothetical protein
MASIAELQAENRRLKAEREVRADFARRDQERKALQKENRALAHPTASRVLGGLKEGFARTAVGFHEMSKSSGKKSSSPGIAFRIPKNKGYKAIRFRAPY